MPVISFSNASQLAASASDVTDGLILKLLIVPILGIIAFAFLTVKSNKLASAS